MLEWVWAGGCREGHTPDHSRMSSKLQGKWNHSHLPQPLTYPSLAKFRMKQDLTLFRGNFVTLMKLILVEFVCVCSPKLWKCVFAVTACHLYNPPPPQWLSRHTANWMLIKILRTRYKLTSCWRFKLSVWEAEENSFCLCLYFFPPCDRCLYLVK